MYDLTKEMVRDEHRKDLIRDAEKYYILYLAPVILLNSHGVYEKTLTYFGRLLFNLGNHLQARYGSTQPTLQDDRFPQLTPNFEGRESRVILISKLGQCLKVCLFCGSRKVRYQYVSHPREHRPSSGRGPAALEYDPVCRIVIGGFQQTPAQYFPLSIP